MESWVAVRNIRFEQDDENGRTIQIGDVFFSSGKEIRNHRLVYCPQCGQRLMPGSINEDEGYHVDGCEGYFDDP